MATLWGELEVQLKEGIGEQETIPSLADTPDSEEGRWREKGDNAVEKLTWESAPYPRVHPWIIGDGVSKRSATSSTASSSAEDV